MRRGLAGRGLGTVMAVLLVAACHDPDGFRRLEPRALVDRAALDFGEVPVGEWREADVRVRNVGFVPFNALEALGLQGNPSFVVEMEPGQVPPQGEKIVRVRFHPLEEGELAEELRLHMDATQREALVSLRGAGTPTPIRFSGNRLDFETLEVDSDRTLPLTVTNPVDLPLAIRVVGPGGTPFTTSTINVPPLQSLVVDTRYFPRDVAQHGARLEVRACEDCTPAVVELTGRSVPDAFEFTPDPVGFPSTPVHFKSNGQTRMRNVTWRPVKVKSLKTSDPDSFLVTRPEAFQELVVDPGQPVEVPMVFAARAAGPLLGTMQVHYESDKARMAPVPLDARGGQPHLAIAPYTLDLGEVPVGGKVELPVRLTNGGSTGQLRITGVRASGDWQQFGVQRPRRNRTDVGTYEGAWPAFALAAPQPTLAAGNDSLEVRVFFEPTQVGAFTADITFTSDASYSAEQTVRVTGRSYPVASCSWRLTPQPNLDFGNVPVGWGAVLGFHFANTAVDVCAVKDIQLEDDGGGAFFMPGGALTGGVVPQDSVFSAMIAFRAPAPGSYTGTLVMTVNDPANPKIRLPIVGHALDTCLTAAPNFIDFGPVRYDCAPPPRRTLISNACSVPVQVTGTSLGHGTSDQFSITEQPAFPLTLAPGQGFEVAAAYSRTVHAQHYTPLYVHATNEPVPFMVPLLAETNNDGLQSETFVQGASSTVDVLFVLGNTTTMGQPQRNLRNALPGWMAAAKAQGLNLRVGVTTTGLATRGACGGPAGGSGGEAGRLYPVSGMRPRVVDVNGLSALQENVLVGECHDLVQGLETMRQALSQPLVGNQDDPRTPEPNDGNVGLMRDQASLSVVMVADEDDRSGFPASSYVQFLQSLKGPNGQNRTRLHALLPSGRCRTAGSSASRIAEVVRGSGGQVADICDPQAYRALLDRLTADAVGPRPDFHLSYPVGNAAELLVTVNGAQSTAWTFDPATNSIVFNNDAIPAPGARITVRYRALCGG